MNFPVLTALGMALSVIGLVGLFSGRLARHQCYGVFALANALSALQNIREGSYGWAVFSAAISAACAYAWWHGGGGDGTKRRLRRLARRFQGVRRTAPVGAS
ncbi:hypothetical protein DEJ49_33295 [Streptomyces venezuelae]|uniref:Uncharacterized protein n=1 Tax=Streptomyces venezuelae TaxID=54571 RepID=A0A5P2CT89_STRVZ|nr:hypothetical protein [Streptomyces venezuelae]QES45217.1 hypothetical protein DEJ49_33295 [Streptomyces venezuelae]